MSFTVAIDGPAAAGKGTLSKAVAAHFGLAHLDTGLLYRAVGAGVLAGGTPIDVARKLMPDDLENPDLRTQEVAEAASKVAVIAEVREALVAFQRLFARREGGAVLDGRDIGTVICPEAEVKLFVTASAETRARRRFDELRDRGIAAEFDTILQEVVARDKRDSERAEAPLKPAEGAVILDTSTLSIAEAEARALDHVRAARESLRIR